MVVIAEPISILTDRDSYIIKGLIRQIDIMLKDNRANGDPTLYDKPHKIMDTYLAGLIYEHGMKILKPLYESIDDYPVVCIILAGGLIKLGIVRNFYHEENRGNIINMIQEYKNFYKEYQIKDLIRSVEKETEGSTLLLSRIKHKDIQEALSNDLGLLIYPLFSTIDECPMTCLAMIYDLIVKEKMKPIFSREDHCDKAGMVKKFKEFYIGNRVKFLIERIAANPDLSPSVKNTSIEKKEAIEELVRFREMALKPIYEVIDDYQLTCVNIIPFLVKKCPYSFQNFGIDITGKGRQNIPGMVNDFKEWYRNEHLHSKPVL
jgi:hypothetical protein